MKITLKEIRQIIKEELNDSSTLNQIRDYIHNFDGQMIVNADVDSEKYINGRDDAIKWMFDWLDSEFSLEEFAEHLNDELVMNSNREITTDDRHYYDGVVETLLNVKEKFF